MHRQPDPDVPVTVAELDELFRARFPVRAASERASLEFVEVAPMGESYGVTLRLVVWDVDGETMSIRDVKEQQVWFDPRDSSVVRLTQYLKAYDYVASRALAHPEIEMLMPHDLFDGRVLKLAKAQTDVDFVKALSVKSRLGKYLTGPL